MFQDTQTAPNKLPRSLIELVKLSLLFGYSESKLDVQLPNQ